MADQFYQLPRDLQGNAKGIDTSRWQGWQDFIAARTFGILFHYIRATVGDYYTDSKFHQHWPLSKAAGLLTAPYLVIAPRPSPTAGQTISHRKISAQAHYDLFMRAMGDKEPDMPVCLDVELSRGATMDEIADLTLDVSRLIESAYGRKPSIYTAKYYFEGKVAPRPEWAQHPLFVANYKTQVPNLPKYWANWVIWQFSAYGLAPWDESQKTDFDIFAGRAEALYTWAGTGPVELPDYSRLATVINALVAQVDKGRENHARLIEKYTKALGAVQEASPGSLSEAWGPTSQAVADLVTKAKELESNA